MSINKISELIDSSRNIINNNDKLICTINDINNRLLPICTNSDDSRVIIENSTLKTTDHASIKVVDYLSKICNLVFVYYNKYITVKNTFICKVNDFLHNINQQLLIENIDNINKHKIEDYQYNIHNDCYNDFKKYITIIHYYFSSIDNALTDANNVIGKVKSVSNIVALSCILDNKYVDNLTFLTDINNKSTIDLLGVIGTLIQLKNKTINKIGDLQELPKDYVYSVTESLREKEDVCFKMYDRCVLLYSLYDDISYKNASITCDIKNSLRKYITSVSNAVKQIKLMTYIHEREKHTKNTLEIVNNLNDYVEFFDIAGSHKYEVLCDVNIDYFTILNCTYGHQKIGNNYVNFYKKQKSISIIKYTSCMKGDGFIMYGSDVDYTIERNLVTVSNGEYIVFIKNGAVNSSRPCSTYQYKVKTHTNYELFFANKPYYVVNLPTSKITIKGVNVCFDKPIQIKTIFGEYHIELNMVNSEDYIHIDDITLFVPLKCHKILILYYSGFIMNILVFTDKYIYTYMRGFGLKKIINYNKNLVILNVHGNTLQELTQGYKG